MPYCKDCGSELPDGAVYCPKCGASMQDSAGPKLAYWGERFVAWLIDVAIIGVILAMVRFAILPSWPSFPWTQHIPWWISFNDFGWGSVIRFLYWTLLEGIYGQSIGKMIMRIKVTRLDGKLINFTQAAIQSIGKAFFLPLDCILGWILYPRKRQRAFHHLSQTLVVKA
jgi:uncharacterized RDD family membrane protein YckC